MTDEPGGGPSNPLKGLKKNKPVLYVGGAAVAYVVYRYWKASQNAAAAPVTAPTDSSVAQGGGGAAMDNTNVGNSTLNTPSTNAAWSQSVVEMLQAQGWDAATVSAALGKYLSGQALTPTEVTIIQSALALAGSPPSGSYGLVRITPATPTSPATPTPTTPVTLGMVVGLHTITSDQTSFTVQWNTVPGATRYRVKVPSIGGDWQTASARHLVPVPPAKRKQRVVVQVSAGDSAGHWGPTGTYWSRTK